MGNKRQLRAGGKQDNVMDDDETRERSTNECTNYKGGEKFQLRCKKITECNLCYTEGNPEGGAAHQI